MKLLHILCFLIPCSAAFTQPNCEAFRYYYKDTLKYEACKKSEQIEGFHQFSKEYQMILDESIKIDSTFAYAYNCKSVAYLKSGDFITWKELKDKAVKYDPQQYLGHRGYLRFLCFRDFEGAIEDFDKLRDMGFQYEEFGMAEALCYLALGNVDKAISILEKEMLVEDYIPGTHDFLHLGVMYLEGGYHDKAVEAFLRQSQETELAESRYYLAMTYKALGMKKELIDQLVEARTLYLKEVRMFQEYIDPTHKIYLDDIESEFKLALSNG